MGADEEERRMDEKGRVTIPRRMREQLNLEPGARVRVEVDDGRVVVRPRVSRTEFIETIRGCVTTETKSDDAPTLTPADVKSDWTSDLPAGRKE